MHCLLLPEGRALPSAGHCWDAHTTRLTHCPHPQLLNCIMDMAEKTRRSLTVLRRCQEADREELNHWIRRYSGSEDPKKGPPPPTRPLSSSVGVGGSQPGVGQGKLWCLARRVGMHKKAHSTPQWCCPPAPGSGKQVVVCLPLAPIWDQGRE